MMRCSNITMVVLNLLLFLLSIPILVGGIWLSQRASTDCERFLDLPVIILGAFLLVVSLAGFVGTCYRVTWLLYTYLFVMLLLIVGVFIFTIFAFAVTNKGAGKVVSGRGFKEYRLGDYSNWFQKRVNDSENWRKINSCLQDSQICKNLLKNKDTQDKFFQEKLSPTESGCCKPPTECGFIYRNATTWEAPGEGFSSKDADCETWSNEQEVLCYDCQSCKAGVLANLKNSWKKVALINIVFLVVLVIVYSIGCCAFKNNLRDLFRRDVFHILIYGKKR